MKGQGIMAKILKNKHMYTRVTVEQFEALQELAEERDISVSTLVRHAITNYLIDQGKM